MPRRTVMQNLGWVPVRPMDRSQVLRLEQQRRRAAMRRLLARWVLLLLPVLFGAGPLTPDFRIVACASSRGYARNCAPPVKLNADGESEIRISLSPYQHSGRVITSVEVLSGSVAFFQPDGRITEKVSVAKDGSFFFNSMPNRQTWSVFSSRNVPLVMGRVGGLDREFEITVPNAGARTVAATLTGSYPYDRAEATLMVDGVLLPPDVFAAHSAWRRAAVISKGKPFVVPDLHFSGRAALLVAPYRFDRPPSVPQGAEIFIAPQFGGFVSRYPLPTSGFVEIDH